eukprot:TRINITY_DN5110_c0_g1_i1.p1 TRINITY_DN5110_c0_g1~~TRINITY_DN5110_c0_g1_i1.p1  ORF type:complete len:428 (-),score=15.54 TRINITY_DN5110_c0_g1_i1:90-1313(-)
MYSKPSNLIYKRNSGFLLDNRCVFNKLNQQKSSVFNQFLVVRNQALRIVSTSAIGVGGLGNEGSQDIPASLLQLNNLQLLLLKFKGMYSKPSNLIYKRNSGFLLDNRCVFNKLNQQKSSVFNQFLVVRNQALRIVSTSAIGVGGLGNEGSQDIPASLLQLNVVKTLKQSMQEMLPLLKLIIPVLCIWILDPVMSLVDTSVVGTKSHIQLAAMSPGCIISDQVGLLLNSVAIVVTNLVSVSMSRGEFEKTGRTIGEAISMTIIIGGVIGFLLYSIAPTLLQLISKNSPEVAHYATSYIQIRSFGLIPGMIQQVCTSLFLAAKDPWTPLYAIFTAAMFNFIGDIILVNYGGFGINGAAFTTVLAKVIGAVLIYRAANNPFKQPSPYEGKQVKATIRSPRFFYFMTCDQV